MHRVLSAALLLATGCGIEHDFSEKYRTDVWYQADDDRVDILWVVDDSCSMSEEQEALASGIGSFVSEMASMDSDFHMGLITTSNDPDDPDRGVLIGNPPVLTPADDYVQLFQDRARVGTEGSDKEEGLAAAVHALSPELTAGPNAGFLRDGAQLMVIVVSDEEDCSDYGELDGLPPTACYRHDDLLPPVEDFIGDLAAVKGDPDDVLVGAIVGDFACADAWPARRYVDAAFQTDGVVGDICESEWSDFLYELGLDAAGIRSSFRTSNAVNLSTLEVTVDGQPVHEGDVDGWTWDPDTWYLHFHGTAIPAASAEVTAAYEVAPGSQPSG